MNYSEIVEKVNLLEKKMLELEKTLKMIKQRPRYGDMYYSISKTGNIISLEWSNDDFDSIRYDSYNCYKTYKEAEKALKEMED